MNPEKLYELNEPFAAGYMEYENEDKFLRFAHAHAVFLKNQPMTHYDGGSLYPCGYPFEEEFGMFPHYNLTMDIYQHVLDKKDTSLYPMLYDGFWDIASEWSGMVHTVAGFGYNHSLPHYGRIMSEGLDSYRERIEKKEGSFRQGLLELLDGIYEFRNNCIEFLQKNNGKKELIEALKKVPFKPAETIYEALVCYNFIFCLDGYDNVGRLDQDLLPFYKGEDIIPVLREFFAIVDRRDGWSASVGPEYNPLTLQCIKAIKGMRRPHMELRVTPDMPQELWDAAIDSLMAGGTNPSLYNDSAYEKALKKYCPHMTHEDFLRFCGVGCTESSLSGLTNAGSVDAGIHLPHIFSEFMRSDMKSCHTFEDFYKGFMELYRSEVKYALGNVYNYHKLRSEMRPNPMRTLLIDDCIDKGLDFTNRGARYTWSVINFAGIVNIIEDMLAVKELVYDKKLYNAVDFISKLDAQEPEFLARCKKCRHFGVDDEVADSFANSMMSEIFAELDRYETFQGGRYFPSSIQFITCATAGEKIPATPDGRAAGTPLADSVGAIHSNDVKGITAMLNSVSALPMTQMPGTPVLNVKMSKTFLEKSLQAIVKGYFAKGGMQMQITCLSQEDLLDAMEHPEEHANLIVRVGGYSEYFVRLSKELQQQIISRTDYV